MTFTLVVALLPLSYTLGKRFALLSSLTPENRFDQPLKRLKLLGNIGFSQKKMVGRKRERSAGIMHFFIFWAALIIGLRELALLGEGFVSGFAEHLPLLGAESWLAYAFVLSYNTAEAVIAAMLLFALYRRLVLRPQRLDLNAEGIVVLLCILGIVMTDLMFDAGRFALIKAGHTLPYLHSSVYGVEMDWAPFASLLAGGIAPLGETGAAFAYHFGFWGHMVIALGFINYLPYTKQFHELTALPNVYFGSLNGPHQPIALLDLEDESAWEKEALGLNRIEQLTWKQGLDLYTCTECGRCYDICPTYVTHKPLTMKWMNDDLRGYLTEEQDTILRSKKSSDAKRLVGDVIKHDTLWACTTCRACEEVCPVSIEHVPRIIAMRQGQTLMAESHPKQLNHAFRGLEQNGNPWNRGYDQRDAWMEGLEQKPPVLAKTPNEKIDVLMWVGCMGAYDNRNQSIARATAKLLQKAKVSFAVLGSNEKCTGDLARRSGNELLYQMLAQENVETLNHVKPKEIVTNCPHCLNSLKNEYPQLEGRYVVYHHSQYIAKLVDEGRLEIEPNLTGVATYHDPCYLGRYNNEYDAPRSLLQKAAKKPPVEMRRSRSESFCCGAGGARMWMEEKIGSRVNEERVRQAKETNATSIITACPFCMTMISDGVRAAGSEDSIQVKDIAEVVLAASEGIKGRA